MIRNVSCLPKKTIVQKVWHHDCGATLFSWKHASVVCQRRRFSQNVIDSRANSQLPILSLPLQYLKGMDPSQFDSNTYQRLDVKYDPNSGKPIISKEENKTSKKLIVSECSYDPQTESYRILWEDGQSSEYSHRWVQQELLKWKGENGTYNDNDSMTKTEPRIKFWRNLDDEQVRNPDSGLSQSFHDTVMTDDGIKRALKALYEYGIVLVTGTPTDDGGSGVAALAAALGGGSVKHDNPNSLLSHYRSNPTSTSPTMLPHGTDGPLRTLYGGVWSTASSGQAEGTSVADSAYGQDGLPLHTDMTYHQDPPGLQIFTMAQPAIKGGESVFADGFALAERLRTNNPEAFATLSQTSRRYHSIDALTGWHLEAHGPVISVRNGHVVGIRHNDLDRLSDLPPADYSQTEQEEFYEKLERAHQAWDELIAMDEFRLVAPLKAGDTMVVANHVSVIQAFSLFFVVVAFALSYDQLWFVSDSRLLSILLFATKRTASISWEICF